MAYPPLPTIDCPPAEIKTGQEFYSKQGETAVIVTWTQPSASGEEVTRCLRTGSYLIH
ncbi:hypothetical protein DPMN_144613 [Dreissena polymorpha]|uniref:Uncharacterized protein n=1 Tax=Dreissena polymorpha TaxID=45954 RepID=A0A9D4J0G4_DREPO|nr:hypothetical protein DPMN_144613 [Dreissena polymorpha]